MEAHEQLRLLRGRLPTEMLEAAAAELARMAATAGWENAPGDRKLLASLSRSLPRSAWTSEAPLWANDAR
jgi:hypothetical protein